MTIIAFVLIKRAASGDYASVARAAWGGFGLELHAPVTIKTARPACVTEPKQKSTGQGNPNKKNAPNGAFLNG